MGQWQQDLLFFGWLVPSLLVGTQETQMSISMTAYAIQELRRGSSECGCAEAQHKEVHCGAIMCFACRTKVVP